MAWGKRFWDDLKASTDASLLAILRFVGLLYGRIDTRLPIDQAFRKSLRHRLSRHAGWRHAFGGITYLLFMVLVVTGVLLSFYYRPSAEEAYQSIQNIVSGVTLGWLMRDVHVWAANLIVLAALVHMGRVFFGAAYKPPRETNWLVGLLLLFVIFAFGATGYLLPWDQWAYWTVTQGLAILGHVPLFGGALVEILRGDPLVSGATLSRFFAIHVIVLPWLALALLMLHFTLVRKHGVAPPAEAATEDLGPSDESGVPFFPNHFLRSLIVGVLVLSLVITAAALYPRDVAAPANPAQPPASLRSTWIVADVSRALIYYLGGWGFAAYLLLGAVMVLLPLFDRSPERRLRQRPIVASLGVVFFLAFAVAWAAGWHLRSVPVLASGELTPIEQPLAMPGPALPRVAPVQPAAQPTGTSSPRGPQ
ncbi:MAG: cytochrome b N-terminal domain-containing protein [Gemmatimonadaceae bacterium]